MPWARLTGYRGHAPDRAGRRGAPDADDRSVNEVFGFMLRLAAMSAQYLTDYVFWYSSAVQMAGSKSQADHARAGGLRRPCKGAGR